MSGADSSQGPGWWQASDGKWYPPESKPGTQPSQPSEPAPSTPTQPSGPPVMSGGGGSGLPPATPIGGGEAGGANDGSFFSRLFDMSFTRFVTPSLIKVLFILGIILVSFVSLGLLIGGLTSLDDAGIVLVLIAPIYWLLGVIYTRVLLELAIVFFRIEVNTRPRA